MKHMKTGQHFNLYSLANKAERLGLYTVDCDITEKPLLYVADKGEIAIINSGGALRLTFEDALKVTKDLKAIVEESKNFHREERSFPKL